MTADVALHTSPFDNLPHKMSQIKESKERDRDDDDDDMRLNKLSKNIIDLLLHGTVQIFLESVDFSVSGTRDFSCQNEPDKREQRERQRRRRRRYAAK